MGERSRFAGQAVVTNPEVVTIGADVFIGYGCLISCEGGLEIADEVMIGPGLNIQGGNHDITVNRRFATSTKERNPPLHIGKGAWIGSNVTLLAGAKIGAYAVIGAGSVVRSEIPDGVVAAGVPCRPLRAITGL